MSEGRKFLWGVSTSSYQTEGNITSNDWHYFTTKDLIRRRISALTTPSIFYKDIRNIELRPAGDAVKFWNNNYYKQDFDNAKSLGLSAFRVSIEWSRVQPQRESWDQNAIDHYKSMLKSMREKGLEPIVTLNHLTLPLWVLTPPVQFKKKLFQYFLPSPLRDLPIGDPPSSDPFWKSLRGWENEQTVKAFVSYVEKIVSEFKDIVDFWITISEPVASIIGGGYLAGVSPPGFFLDGKRSRMALHNLIEAHVQAYDKISELDDIDANNDGITKDVGFSHLMADVEPFKGKSLFGSKSSNLEAAKNFSYFMNDYFLNAVIEGEEDLNYLDTLERYNKNSRNFVVNEKWKRKADFIGLNYYRRLYVRDNIILAKSDAKFVGGAPINDLGNSENHGQLSDLGWEIYPNGLYKIVTSLKEFSLPIFITENGVADKSDTKRPRFIIEHLEQIKRCLDERANIMGFLYWSLMDNYEWHEGYRPEGKFGLYYIDFEKPDLSRKITEGAKVLKLIIEESLLQNKNGQISNDALSQAKGKYFAR